MRVYLLILLAGTAIGTDESNRFTSEVWAVLVAGSRGWGNYRHQADVCHAYHTLVNKGVPKERIITFMYDDIASNTENPYPGKIFNTPGGEDVYEGVVIDYKGSDVNIETFRNVLLANASGLANTKGSGRMLESKEKDHVFINFVDHGGSGVLSFPIDTLYANDLMDILKRMKNEKKFETLVMFVEACYAGSMFDNIIGEHDNIFVSTAAAPDESSYGCYCDNELETCLADLYSVTWTDRMDKLNYSESLFEQFDAVRTKVLKKSHVNLYGDYSVGLVNFGFIFNPEKDENMVEDSNEYELNDDYVDNTDIPVYLAHIQMQKAMNEEEKIIKKEKYERIIKNRNFGDKLVSEILANFSDGNLHLKKDLETNHYSLDESIFECYKAIINAFKNTCFEINKNTYFLKHTYKFANICAKKLDQGKAVKSIESICKGLNRDDMLII